MFRSCRLIARLAGILLFLHVMFPAVFQPFVTPFERIEQGTWVNPQVSYPEPIGLYDSAEIDYEDSFFYSLSLPEDAFPNLDAALAAGYFPAGERYYPLDAVFLEALPGDATVADTDLLLRAQIIREPDETAAYEFLHWNFLPHPEIYEYMTIYDRVEELGYPYAQFDGRDEERYYVLELGELLREQGVIPDFQRRYIILEGRGKAPGVVYFKAVPIDDLDPEKNWLCTAAKYCWDLDDLPRMDLPTFHAYAMESPMPAELNELLMYLELRIFAGIPYADVLVEVEAHEDLLADFPSYSWDGDVTYPDADYVFDILEMRRGFNGYPRYAFPLPDFHFAFRPPRELTPVMR